MFDYGDMVMFASAAESTVPEHRDMRGIVVEIEDDQNIKVAWYEDETCSVSVGVDTYCRHVSSVKKVPA